MQKNLMHGRDYRLHVERLKDNGKDGEQARTYLFLDSKLFASHRQMQSTRLKLPFDPL